MRHYHPGGDTACALTRYYDFVPRRYLMPIAPIDKVWDSAISAHMNFGPRFVADITLFVEYIFAKKMLISISSFTALIAVYFCIIRQSILYSEAL
ncbi:hypothetical protein BO83DRAFT_132230 [Aspergillus eucalypticola CBS 122712]|uniref:Uncharacterized protein n=1 Tax=Aspergillus eucalypticola (strain CBS 122712 / IBT 29274) TaxID=1448314 RepID=A0A317W8N4_ASPEC|nr:uncharacterized protein BO83DRAFT_132230 [Aspergillus eucalypticola CBS 122712]PWY82489.1 hypothetical protein BO83DRAFT_132230 [Aspergillus eucalypticola CBS 122712]